MTKTASKPGAAGAKSQLPAQYQEQIAREMAEMKSRIAAPSGDRIRFVGNTGFRTPDGMEGEELEVVILDFTSVNLFYEGAYDRDNPAPPSCFAIGNEPTKLVPSPNSPAVQSDSCAACPNNAFGSAGRGKACKNTRLLAVTPAVVEEGGDQPVWIMSIPPTSIKAFDAYVSSLVSKHETSPIGVVTQVTMDRSVDFAAPRFKTVKKFDPSELGPFFEIREAAKQRILAEPDVTPRTAKAPAPRGKMTPARGARR